MLLVASSSTHMTTTDVLLPFIYDLNSHFNGSSLLGVILIYIKRPVNVGFKFYFKRLVILAFFFCLHPYRKHQE